MSASNIEEGCIARVITNSDGDNENSPNAGKIVTVGEFMGKVKGIRHTDIWEVDLPMKLCRGDYVYHMTESCLQRIDDGNLTEEELEQEEGLVLIGENE